MVVARGYGTRWRGDGSRDAYVRTKPLGVRRGVDGVVSVAGSTRPWHAAAARRRQPRRIRKGEASDKVAVGE